jgi:hypothetical protein
MIEEATGGCERCDKCDREYKWVAEEGRNKLGPVHVFRRPSRDPPRLWQFPYLQLIFCVQLIHRPGVGSSTHL